MPQIINTHDQLMAAGGGIAIVPAYYGVREVRIHGWRVYRIVRGKPVNTDTGGHWTDYGLKRFTASGAHYPNWHARQRAALLQAQEWIAKTYGEKGPWARNRMGDYVPERINDEFPIPRRDKEKTTNA